LHSSSSKLRQPFRLAASRSRAVAFSKALDSATFSVAALVAFLEVPTQTLARLRTMPVTFLELEPEPVRPTLMLARQRVMPLRQLVAST
jgi:hypothetical protein